MQNLVEKFKSIATKSFSAEELEAARDRKFASLIPWVFDRWPKISDECIKQNLTELSRIHEYDIACKACMGIAMCLSGDGKKMQGKLAPNGRLIIWMEPCPNNFRNVKAKPKDEEEASQPVKLSDWRPSAKSQGELNFAKKS